MARMKPAPSSDISQETHDKADAVADTLRPRHTSALVEIQLADEVCDPIPHYVEVALRTSESKAGRARLRVGLIRSGATLPGTGRKVESNADALRYLLEQLAAAN
jgi:hypothetical protein